MRAVVPPSDGGRPLSWHTAGVRIGSSASAPSAVAEDEGGDATRAPRLRAQEARDPPRVRLDGGILKPKKAEAGTLLSLLCTCGFLKSITVHLI